MTNNDPKHEQSKHDAKSEQPKAATHNQHADAQAKTEQPHRHDASFGKAPDRSAESKALKEENIKKSAPKSSGPYDDLIGTSDLQPGESGWLSLDDTGKPVGVYRYPPEAGSGVNSCPITVHGPEAAEQLTTITGASITDHMQPSNDRRLVPAEPEAETAKKA